MTATKNTRLYGNVLGLTINGADYWADVASWSLAPADGDAEVLTFADARTGATSSWTLSGTSIISFDSTSFWSMVWANAGKTVDFVVAPHGNKTATDTKPHFKGKVKIGARPGISNEAANDSQGATFDWEWTVEGQPEMVTTKSTLGSGAMEDVA